MTYKLKSKFVEKLGVINNNTEKENNAIVVWYILFDIVISIIATYFYSQIFNMWYIVVILSLVTVYAIFYSASRLISMKLRKVQKNFPKAVQIFTDEYITTKNIKTSLNATYKKMPKGIDSIFEKLSRELSSSYDFEKHIIHFANNLNYIWGYAFSELLIMSYEGVGDISEELLFLNELINEDITAEEKNATDMAGNKMMFVILTGATLFTFVFNIIANPMAKELYFYTTTGNNIIFAWVLIIVFGFTTSLILDYL